MGNRVRIYQKSQGKNLSKTRGKHGHDVTEGRVLLQQAGSKAMNRRKNRVLFTRLPHFHGSIAKGKWELKANLDNSRARLQDSKTQGVVDLRDEIDGRASNKISGSRRTRSTETSDALAVIQAQLNKFGREIKKVNEKVYAAQVGCELCKGPRYTKDCPLKEEGKTLEEAYYTQFGVPFQQGGQYRAAAPRFYKRNKANPSYQERRC
ncbi:hypothetical protein Tco_0307212 [Tanacetum coccineum]